MSTALADVKQGAFVRKESIFRGQIQKGGQFPPAAGRYILFVSLACPWACRCLAVRRMKGLVNAIRVVVVSPVWRRTKPNVDEHEGWHFDEAYDEFTSKDPIFGCATIRDFYEEVMKRHSIVAETRFSVPILFDSLTQSIVNNESSEIIRFFNVEFNEFAEQPEVNLRPSQLIESIDAMNDSIYNSVNNGVYRCGFAQTQAAYNEAVTELFCKLDELDELLGKQRFLVSNAVITEADIRLFMTLVRFDPVYVVHFKCDKKTIREYSHLPLWMRDVYQTAGFDNTIVNVRHIKEHYYMSHRSINKYGIVPIGAPLGLERPHGREKMFA